MRRLERLVVPGLLAGAWLTVHAVPLASATGPVVERVLARSLVIAFAMSLVVEAIRALPRSRSRTPLRAPAMARFCGLWLACTLVPAALAGVIHLAPRDGSAARWSTGLAYGPLTDWPHLEAVWPALGVGVQAGAGRILMLLVLGFLLALSARSAFARAATLPGATARAWPGVLAAHACPGCLAPVLALAAAAGGSALAPTLRHLAHPLSQTSALLELAAPLLALLVLVRIRDGGATTGTRPWPSFAAALLPAPWLMAALFRGRLNALFPGSDPAPLDAINSLFLLVTLVAVLLFLPVIILAVYYPWRYRAREGGPDAAASPVGPRARRVLIGVYTVIPAVLILSLGAFSVGVLTEIERTPQEPALHVNVTGEQWNWTFTMPDGSAGLNTLRVPQGETVVLHVSSIDVIHSFYVPSLGVHIDAQPHHDTDFWFVANEPGTYRAYCAEFCGYGHTVMRAVVIVEPAAVPRGPTASG